MTLSDYADSSKTQCSGSMRVKKAISSLTTDIKCKIRDMTYFWYIVSCNYVVYHVYRPFICEKTPDGEIYADL